MAAYQIVYCHKYSHATEQIIKAFYPRHFFPNMKAANAAAVAVAVSAIIDMLRFNRSPNNFISTISILIFWPVCILCFIFLCFFLRFSCSFLLINRQRFKFQILKINKMNWLNKNEQWRKGERERKSGVQSEYTAGMRACVRKRWTEKKSRSKIHT